MKNIKCKLFFYLILILNLFMFSFLKAEIKIKIDTNGYQYEEVKNNKNLGRLYTLENGLKIYLVQNNLKPIIETRIVINAGAKYDPNDNTGLAHYLEHMMFKGNEKIGTIDFQKEKLYIEKIENLYEEHKKAKTQKEKDIIYSKIDKLSYEAAKYAIPNEYDSLANNIGGTNLNAYTSADMTVYQIEIPSKELERWVQLERIRFENLVLRLFHTELEAVYEEFNQDQDQDQNWVFSIIDNKLYSKHPYGEKTIIGTANHLKNPSMKAIIEFYKKYYVANNMAIILSGDFEYDKTIKFIKNHWGNFRSNLSLDLKVNEALPFNKTITETIYGKEKEFVAIAYRFKGEKNQAESMKLKLLEKILLNEKNGILDTNIIQKQKISDLFILIDLKKDFSTLMLFGFPKENQSLEQVKNILLNEIENLKNGKYSEELLQFIKNNTELENELQSSDNEYLVDRFINIFVNNKKVDALITDNEIFNNISKKEMIKFSNKKLTNCVIVYKKNGDNKLKTLVKKPKITPLEMKKEKSAFAKNFLKEPINNSLPKFIDFEKELNNFKLKDNTEVFYMKNASTKTFKLMYTFNVGTYNDKYLKVALDYLEYLEIDKFSPTEFKSELNKNGLDISLNINTDKTTITLSGLSNSFEKGIDLLHKYIFNFKPNEKVYNNYISDLIFKNNERKKDKLEVIESVKNYCIFDNEKSVFSNEELEKLKHEEIIKIIKSLFQNKQEIFYFGPSTIDVIKNNLNSFLDKKNKIYFIDFDSIQNDILLISKGSTFDLDYYSYSMFYNSFYPEIIFRKLREEKALAYKVNTYIEKPDYKEDSFLLISEITTQSDKTYDTVKSLVEFFKDFMITEDEFNEAKNNFIKALENERIIKDDIYYFYSEFKKLDITKDPREYTYNKIKNMSYKEFKTFFKTNITNQKYKIIIIGKKESIIKNQFNEFGEVEELYLEEIFGY